MRIAIISDVHNNTTNLKKVLAFCTQNEIKTLICCGDLASDETLDFLNDNFSGEIYYTFGNMDNDQMQKHKLEKTYKHIQTFNNFGEIKIENKNIAFVHYPREAKKLAASGKYGFVFYGHTHKPWVSYAKASEDQDRKCTMLNPGNVAGEIYPPTFAVWNTDDDKFELIRIHDIKNF